LHISFRVAQEEFQMVRQICWLQLVTVVIELMTEMLRYLNT